LDFGNAKAKKIVDLERRQNNQGQGMQYEDEDQIVLEIKFGKGMQLI
jgi:hypothetical protein